MNIEVEKRKIQFPSAYFILLVIINDLDLQQVPFEVLIATMFRTDLGFLETMFSKANLDAIPILIINQTDKNKQLISSSPNIRVINTEERGLAKSRNLALQQSRGEVCLIADDDVIYESNFKQTILNAYKEWNDAVAITFAMTDFNGNLFRKYPSEGIHTKRTIDTVNGVVISCRPQQLKAKNIGYHSLFGLGEVFETGDELVLMRALLKAGCPCYFKNEVIVQHPKESSGQEMGSDRVIYARSALKYTEYGVFAYLWVYKYVRFLVAHKFISVKEVPQKIKKGFEGITQYRKLSAKNK